MTVTVLAIVIIVIDRSSSRPLLTPLFLRCSCRSCIVGLTTAIGSSTAPLVQFTLALGLVSGGFLLRRVAGEGLWCHYSSCSYEGQWWRGGTTCDRKSLADEDVFAVWIQVVQCLTIDPNLIELQTRIEFYSIIPAFVCFGEPTSSRCGSG